MKPPCDYCETTEGFMLQTNLDTGDTVTVCANDYGTHVLGVALAFIQGMDDATRNAYAQILDEIATELVVPPPTPPKPPRTKSKAKGALAEPVDAPPEALSMPVALDPPCAECGGTQGTGDSEKLLCDSCGAVIATVESAEPSDTI